MTPKRLYLIMLIVTACAALGVVGASIVGIGILGKQADSLMEAKLQNSVLDEQQVSLTSAKKAIQTYSELNTIAQAVVPQDKDQAKTVRNINDIAKGLGIRLSAINFPPSSLGQAVKSSTKKTGETQVTAVKGIKGLFEMQITIQSDTEAPITYDKFIEFLARMENNRRTAQVSNITILPNSDGSKLTFNLVLSTYIKP